MPGNICIHLQQIVLRRYVTWCYMLFWLSVFRGTPFNHILFIHASPSLTGRYGGQVNIGQNLLSSADLGHVKICWAIILPGFIIFIHSHWFPTSVLQWVLPKNVPWHRATARVAGWEGCCPLLPREFICRAVPSSSCLVHRQGRIKENAMKRLCWNITWVKEHVG